VSEARPFLKWIGGKRALLPALLPHVPASFGIGRYFEPFAGGAALFFELARQRPELRAVLSDSNDRLMRTYCAVRDSVEDVIRLLRAYPSDVEFFRSMRETEIDRASNARLAAWFIYLNRTGYNGMYRVNKAGRVNMSFGDYEAPTVCDAENLRACSRVLANVDLRCEPFEIATRRAARGDFVYFDPPYIPVSASASFTAYTADGFTLEHQQRLADHARTLKARGVRVLLSNSAAPLVHELYRDGFTLAPVLAPRSVNSRGDRRGKVTELLIQ